MNLKGAVRQLRSEMRPRQFAAPSALLAAALLLQLAARFSPQLVERYYGRGLFPRLASVFSFAGAAPDFSLAEFGLVALVAAVAAWVAWAAYRLVTKRKRWPVVMASALVGLAWISGTALLLFLLFFGLNYQRPALAENLGLTTRDPSLAEAASVGLAVVEGVNRNYSDARAHVDKERGSLMPLTRAELYEILNESFEREPLLRGVSGSSFVPPKPVYFSRVLSRMGISGVYSPFTGEPNYNAAQPDSGLPFTVAHEMAHARGFARESEANFVAFLVCSKSSHPYVRYSGYLGALRVMRIVFRLSPERYRKIFGLLEEGPRADLVAQSRFWLGHSGRLTDVSRRFNDIYLKANGIRSGVRNYDEAASLIVAYQLNLAGPKTEMKNCVGRSGEKFLPPSPPPLPLPFYFCFVPHRLRPAPVWAIV